MDHQNHHDHHAHHMAHNSEPHSMKMGDGDMDDMNMTMIMNMPMFVSLSKFVNFYFIFYSNNQKLIFYQTIFIKRILIWFQLIKNVYANNDGWDFS